MNLSYCVDVDGTIAFPGPEIFDRDFQRCAQKCVDAGLVTAREIAGLRRHTELLILPGVSATHVPAPGAVETLQALNREGAVIHYCTARTSIDPKECTSIHEATRAWLKHHAFPGNVSFAKLIGDKLLQALNMAAPYTLLIDDRATGLLDAYHRIKQSDPTRAEQIRQRIFIVSYGKEVQAPEDAPRTVVLKDWSRFHSMLSGVESMVGSTISMKG